MSTNSLEPKENMNFPRCHHGLYKMARKIFAFGGSNGQSSMKSAEVYDIVQNSWVNLPDMPEAGIMVTCARV